MVGIERAGERGSVVVDRTLDRTEFEQIYYRNWPDVFRYALLLSHNHHDAEDVAAEAFRRALEAWCAGHGPKGEVLPWLFVITRRIAIDRHRRGRLFSWIPIELAPEPEDGSEEPALRRSETWIWFEQLSTVLPEAQREALLLRFAFDLSDSEASKVMRTSAGNVRTLVSRGLATLRKRPEVKNR